MYGNESGLPGLPKTTYVSVGGRKVVPKPPRTQMRPIPPAAPMKTARAPRPIQKPIGPDPGLTRRIDSLDLRINSTEQGNRTLLDELMRLQQDLKGNVRKNEVEIQDERNNRSRLEMTVRQVQSKGQEFEDRIRKNETNQKDSQAALLQTSEHVRTVERMVSSLQHEQHERNGGSANKVEDLRRDMKRISLENEQLNKIVKNLREEGRDNVHRVDTLQDEVLQVQSNMKLHSRLLEEKPKTVQPKGAGIDPNILHDERANTDSKIFQLNSTIQDLSSRLSDEVGKREKLEQDFNNKLNQMLREVSASKTAGKKAEMEYDSKMKEVQMGLMDSDKQQIRVEMSNVANDLNKKIVNNDAKIREDILNKITVIEDSLVGHTKSMKEKEKVMDDKIDKGIKEIKEKNDQDSSSMQDSLTKQVTENNEKLSQLNKRMADVEQDVREHKLEQEKLLQAEITERINNDKIIDAKVEDLEDDVQLGFKTIQEQLGGVSKENSARKPAASTPSVNVDEIVQMQEENAEGIRQQVRKDMGALEKRVSQLETDIKQKNDVFENRLQTVHNEDREAANIMGDQIQQQIDGLAFKQNKLKKKVDELDKELSERPDNEPTENNSDEAIDKLRLDLRKEQKERRENIEEIEENLKKIVGNNNQGSIPSLAQLNTDVDQTQTGLKKCAESIHTVKSMFNEKIRDETRIREKQNSILETDVERLDTKIKDLKARMKISNQDLNDTVDLDDIF